MNSSRDGKEQTALSIISTLFAAKGIELNEQDANFAATIVDDWVRSRLQEVEKERDKWHEAFDALTRIHQEFSAKYGDKVDRAKAAESALAKARKALEKVAFVASENGHAPCRCGGIGPEGVCSNTCSCEWAIEIRAALGERDSKDFKRTREGE